MKKIVTLAAAVALVASLAACQQKTTGKVAVLDPTEVFTSCAPCQEGGEYLRGLSQNLQQELTSLQASMQDDTSEEAPAKFQERYQQIQKRMTDEQTRIAGKLDDAFQQVMTDYRAKAGVSVILNKENVLAYDAEQDVTAEVIAAMNAANIDLELPEAAAPAAEEAAPEGEQAQ